MSPRVALKILLSIVFALIIFHLCILLKIIPYEITWGGRLTNDTEMYVFETVSLLINLYLGFILLIRGKFIRQYLASSIVNISLWVFFALFVLNTVGNMLAKTNFEKSFALVTLMLSLLIWVILRSKKSKYASI
ncbi:hypothetical protein OKW21_004662 [Catalinimonas alkaloidigena]|uniref:hypothetical protein n=1 Tax=Catalinimonas alkaloidigena TaxID=1075417 RepID=UPI00240524DB|nr:hypothetical protein [Catalinimonas alkaloidigena]MDF9799399.1 hypothetical protein [Catalinimonas alkaloidigena]